MASFWRFSRILALAFCSMLALAAPALAQKAYIRNDLASDGQRLEERLKRDVAVSNQPLAALLRNGEAALNRGDARAALAQGNAAVVADLGSSAAWRLMARAAIALEPKDYRERYELRERAVTAAYIAYQRAGTRAEEALSLAAMARIFSQTEAYRPALTAYRLSLELAENAALRKDYEELREKRGSS
jgi:alpha-2-macroglobulin